VLGEKLSGEPANQSVSMLGIVSEAIFIWSSRIRPTPLGKCERLPCTGIAHRKRTWTGVESVRVMYIRFSLQGIH
jgi:hypothetical protein